MGKKNNQRESNERRERALELQKEIAKQQKRETQVKIVGGVTVLLIVVGMIFGAFLLKQSSTTDIKGLASAKVDFGATMPKGVFGADDKYAFGFPLTEQKEGIPTLEIWSDFQCPNCATMEREFGEEIFALGDQGKANLIARPATFLDRNLSNDSSVRAVAAWGCAIDAGVGREYYKALYENQPVTEGVGWEDAQFLDYGTRVGLEGAEYDTFAQCVTDRVYLPWGANSQQVFEEKGHTGTPTAVIDDVRQPQETLFDMNILNQAIENAINN